MADRSDMLPIDTESLDKHVLTVLVEASAVINRTLDVPETLAAIARMAARVMNGDASSVLTLEKEPLPRSCSPRPGSRRCRDSRPGR